MADEIGLNEKTPHTHIFVCFSSRVRFSTIQKHFKQAHIEKCRGLVSENVNYIKKAGKWKDIKGGTQVEGSFEEYGQKPPDSKGSNFDLSELYNMINDGMTNAEILACNQDYIMQIDKLDKIRTIILQDRYKDEIRLNLKVTYIYGETGTGKTRGVLERHGNANVYRVTDYLHPFENYNSNTVICFDEFRSSIKLKDMLLYCDIYPIELPARYANKFACYETVYIISNWALEKQYSELQKDDKESWNAFLRRIHEVQIYTHEGITTYNSVQEYFDRDSHFQKMTETEMTDNPFN